MRDFIEKTISENPIVIFMKGTKKQPYCGFSSAVVYIFNSLEADFKDVNVLENDELRQAIKDYSNWPTLPQVYINGEFIGGCDIIRQLHANGELKSIINK